jgi:hypothetical protein
MANIAIMYNEEGDSRDYDTRQDYGIRRAPDEPEDYDLDEPYEL